MSNCNEIIKRLENLAKHAVHYVGEPPFVMSLDDGIALHDAINLLKAQEARVIELSEISPNIYVWLEDRDDGTVFPLKGGVIDPDGDDYFRFDADFGEDFVYYPTGPFGKHWRVWDKCPTPEQMRETKWEEK